MAHRTAPTNSDDTIDSRDVIERIEELETEREGWVEGRAGEDINSAERATWNDAWANANPEDAAELAALDALASEGEGYAADWHHGEPLIRDSYFTDYARELLEDCGTIPKDFPWYVVIDWDATAEHIRADYTAIDFDGVTYWVR